MAYPGDCDVMAHWCERPAAQKGEGRPWLHDHCNMAGRSEVEIGACTKSTMTKWPAASCRSGSEHRTHTLRSSAVHLEVGDFTCVEPRRPALHLRRCVQGHLAWMARTPDRHRAPAQPAAGCSAVYAPEPDQATAPPVRSANGGDYQAAASCRICSVDYSLSPLSCLPQVFRFTSLSSR